MTLINNLLRMFRENHMLSTMIGGSFMFGGVLFLLLGIPGTAQIGFALLYFTPIPPVVYWMVKKETPDNKDAQRLAK